MPGGPQPGSGPPEGNQNAKSGTEWRQAIRAALAHRGEQDFRKGLLKVANRMIDLAEAGDVACIKEIGERFDGKAHQSSEVDVRGTMTVTITPTDAGL